MSFEGRNPERAKKEARIPKFVEAAELTMLINVAARLTNQAARIRLGEVGAWPGQIPILLWLLEKDGIIQKDLVKLVEMEQPSLAEHLDRMEKSGLLIRKRGTDDRRKYRIHLTPRGKSVASEVASQLEDGAKIFMSGIKDAEMKTFYEVMSKVIQNLTGFVRLKKNEA
jgi:MarR family transcriptional regulator for hemolysin